MEEWVTLEWYDKSMSLWLCHAALPLTTVEDGQAAKQAFGKITLQFPDRAWRLVEHSILNSFVPD